MFILRAMPQDGICKTQLCLAGAAENVYELVLYDLLDVGAGGLEVLTGVKVIRMLAEVLADAAGHGCGLVRGAAPRGCRLRRASCRRFR